MDLLPCAYKTFVGLIFLESLSDLRVNDSLFFLHHHLLREDFSGSRTDNESVHERGSQGDTAKFSLKTIELNSALSLPP